MGDVYQFINSIGAGTGASSSGGGSCPCSVPPGFLDSVMPGGTPAKPPAEPKPPTGGGQTWTGGAQIPEGTKPPGSKPPEDVWVNPNPNPWAPDGGTELGGLPEPKPDDLSAPVGTALAEMCTKFNENGVCAAGKGLGQDFWNPAGGRPVCGGVVKLPPEAVISIDGSRVKDYMNSNNEMDMETFCRSQNLTAEGLPIPVYDLTDIQEANRWYTPDNNRKVCDDARPLPIGYQLIKVPLDEWVKAPDGKVTEITEYCKPACALYSNTEDKPLLDALGFPSLDAVVCDTDKEAIIERMLEVLDELRAFPNPFDGVGVMDAIQAVNAVSGTANLYDVLVASTRFGRGDFSEATFALMDMIPGFGNVLSKAFEAVGGGLLLGQLDNLPDGTKVKIIGWFYVALDLAGSVPHPAAPIATMITIFIDIGRKKWDQALATLLTLGIGMSGAGSKITDPLAKAVVNSKWVKDLAAKFPTISLVVELLKAKLPP